MRLNLVRSILFAALGMLLLAGCGATDAVDKQGYIKENNEIQTRAAAALGNIDMEDEGSIDQAIKEVDAAVADFKKLDVPKDYAEEHDQMVESLEELSDVMSEIKVAVEDGDTEALTGLMTRMNESQSKFNAAIDAMNADRA